MASSERQNRIGIFLGNISYVILFLTIPTAFLVSIITDEGFLIFSFSVFFAFLLAFFGQAISIGEAKKPTKRAATITFIPVVLLISSVLFSPYPIHFWLDQIEKDKAAEWAGQLAADAEKSYFNKYGRYTSSLEKLKEIDETLTANREITFVFLHASSSGFSLYTKYHHPIKCPIFSNESRTYASCFDLPREPE